MEVPHQLALAGSATRGRHRLREWERAGCAVDDRHLRAGGRGGAGRIRAWCGGNASHGQPLRRSKTLRRTGCRTWTTAPPRRSCARAASPARQPNVRLLPDGSSAQPSPRPQCVLRLRGQTVGDHHQRHRPAHHGRRRLHRRRDALFATFASFAETEREYIGDRTHDGLETATTKGKFGGRPRAVVDDGLAAAQARLRRAEPQSVTAIAR